MLTDIIIIIIITERHKQHLVQGLQDMLECRQEEVCTNSKWHYQ